MCPRSEIDTAGRDGKIARCVGNGARRYEMEPSGMGHEE